MSDKPASLNATPPKATPAWLADLKVGIHTAQQRAAQAVNRELVALYWHIGRDILARQAGGTSPKRLSTTDHFFAS